MKSTVWNTANIPDQSGRTVIVTGANSGIGFEAAKELALKGAVVILAVRSQQKGDAAAKAIQALDPQVKVTVQLIDLASLKSVKAFSTRFTEAHSALDLLINNAGIMIPPHSLTEDGFESQMGTNHFGHFALTAQLFPLLQATKGSRIVNVSSSAHNMGKLNFDDLTWEKRKYAPLKSYGDSKIANLYFTYELALRLQASKSKVMVTAAHPGVTETNLAKSGFLRGLNRLFAQTGPMGALPTLMAAVEGSAKSGDYFGPSGLAEWKGYPKQVYSNKLSHDAEIARRLWETSEELTGVTFTI